MNCRHCGSTSMGGFADLGSAPPSNAYLTAHKLSSPELFFPLRVMVCLHCKLVQTEDFAAHDSLFADDYAYFSSFSAQWLAHAEKYVSDMCIRFDLGAQSMVAEIAANDGYLLQFVKGRGIPCFGVEPTESTADAARQKDLHIVQEFFGEAVGARLAKEGKSTDVIAANNVLAHVPDINDFVSGFTAIMKPNGVATFEFPHLVELVKNCQFDTIYHEHFSYLSLLAISRVFEANGLVVFDIEKLTTHGGSLRVYAQRADTGQHVVTENVKSLQQTEQELGLDGVDYYSGLQPRAEKIKDDVLTFLIEAKRAGKTVGGYGAAAKGNTLLNFAGVRGDLLPYVVDLSPSKAGKFMPGSRIPIVTQEHLLSDKPDYILILPWNLKQEVMAQLEQARAWGAQFVTAVPTLTVE
jgi:2-polyprenyl-3-methyl-5-hydroxy-6-metoxy-1,4-benzoquinol methylase